MQRRRSPGHFLILFALGCSPASAPVIPPSPTPAASDAPPAPRPLAVPGPAAAPCTSDSMCGHHRCNRAYGKCAFPCVTDADCSRGTSCFTAVISTCQPTPPNLP